MKKIGFIVLIGILIVIAAAAGQYIGKNANDEHVPDENEDMITNFEECAAAGNVIMESYPEQCRANGKTFVRDIGNELEKSDLIRVTSPRPGETIGKRFTITGEARGFWYFEATFPIAIKDDKGNTLLETYIQADGEWMTEEFVPFSTEFSVDFGTAENGEIILKKDNPSGLPENDDELRIPVHFAQ